MNNFWQGFEKQALKVPKIKSMFGSKGEGKVQSFLNRSNIAGHSATGARNTSTGKRLGF